MELNGTSQTSSLESVSGRYDRWVFRKLITRESRSLFAVLENQFSRNGWCRKEDGSTKDKAHNKTERRWQSISSSHIDVMNTLTKSGRAADLMVNLHGAGGGHLLGVTESAATRRMSYLGHFHLDSKLISRFAMRQKLKRRQNRMVWREHKQRTGVHQRRSFISRKGRFIKLVSLCNAVCHGPIKNRKMLYWSRDQMFERCCQ